MRTVAPPLAPYLRSDSQARLLAIILLRPDEQFSIADLGRATGSPTSVVHKEVSRLVDASVLADTRIGRSRLVRANPDYPLLAPLTQIIAATYGPAPVLSEALADVDGVERAYIFGSWAARANGQPGDQPRDIDVLVVGDAARARLNEVATRAEREIGIPVAVTRVTAESWHSASEPFIRTVRGRPLVPLATGQPEV